MARLQFETKNGKAFVVGGSDQVLNRWDTVNDNDACLTGVYGVYKVINDQNVRMLSSIGFYFDGEGSEEDEAPLVEVSTDDDSGEQISLVVGILLILLAVGMLGCSAIVIYMCMRSAAPKIVIEGEGEVEHADDASIIIRTPRKTLKDIDNETYSGKEMGSVMHMLSNLDGRNAVKIDDFLKGIKLDHKYLDMFKKAGVETIDDFMELEPEQLEVLNLEEDDLATILYKIQQTMDEEDAKLAATFQAKNEYDQRAGNTMERIQVKKILQELGLDQKYLQNFISNGIDTVEEFLTLDENGLEKLNVETDDMDMILTHI